MQEIGTLTWIFMLLVRIAAGIYVAIGALGMLWFSEYYFTREHYFDTAIKAIPLICLFLSVITSEKWFRRGFYWAYQAILAIGVTCVVMSMISTLNLPNGSDYAAFQVHFLSLGVLLVFVLRAIFVRQRLLESKEPASQ